MGCLVFLRKACLKDNKLFDALLYHDVLCSFTPMYYKAFLQKKQTILPVFLYGFFRKK